MECAALCAGYTLHCFGGYKILSSDVAATAGTCDVCPAGTYSEDGLRCIPCSVGTIAANTLSKTCNMCPTGTISVNAANPAGASEVVIGLTYIYGVSGGDSCLNCPAGYYQALPGGHVCLPCPPGERRRSKANFGGRIKRARDLGELADA
jgi:hypothetical protein